MPESSWQTLLSRMLAVADDLIVEVGRGSPPERGEDLDGDLLLPGLVELHTDHLETHYIPRPKVFWDPVAAVVSFDGQLATSASCATSIAAKRAVSPRRNWTSCSPSGSNTRPRTPRIAIGLLSRSRAIMARGWRATMTQRLSTLRRRSPMVFP